tara:strand:- start:856 stop:1242 length:387 start_codon:yes stop_codon:yes gene_type:complete
MKYGYQRIVKQTFEYVDKDIREQLAKVGFGIITEIDIMKTFKEKLDIEYPKFKILGACNPALADQALDIQPEVAMLMPCNVVFWENEDKTVTLSSVDAEQQLRATHHESLVELGRDVNAMLKSAVDSV